MQIDFAVGLIGTVEPSVNISHFKASFVYLS